LQSLEEEDNYIVKIKNHDIINVYEFLDKEVVVMNEAFREKYIC
jgi:hypothetical protein